MVVIFANEMLWSCANVNFHTGAGSKFKFGDDTFIKRKHYIKAQIRALTSSTEDLITNVVRQYNSLTIRNIKVDRFNMRNNLLVSFTTKFLSYCGLSRDFLHTLQIWLLGELIDNRSGNLFETIVTLPREQVA